jgi:hypothetical protein
MTSELAGSFCCRLGILWMSRVTRTQADRGLIRFSFHLVHRFARAPLLLLGKGSADERSVIRAAMV